MKFINTTYEDFVNRTKGKSIILFGASSAWHYFLKTFPTIDVDVLDRTVSIVDNSLEKQGSSFEISGRTYMILNPNEIAKECHYAILITVSLAYQEKICEQLKSMNLPEEMECYSLPLMTYSDKKADNSCVDIYFKNHKEKKIPAKIHSFWFSGDEKPDLYKRCIESWYKYCPNFEIKEWNADNYDVTKNQYMHEAFEHKKWAFVSDFARLDLLNQFGGIYMDMDVELLAPIDSLLYADSFFCRQEDGLLELGSGFGVQAGDSLIQTMLNTYTGRKLIKPNGEMDKTPQPEWLSNILAENGFYKCYDSQIVGERLILSNDYITCATGTNPTETAQIGVHWHNGGWLGEKERKLIHDSFKAKDILQKKYFI